MPEDSNSPQPQKYFDVARPGTVPTDATSKPVVVGHGVSQVDPMMQTGAQQAVPVAVPETQNADPLPSAPEVSLAALEQTANPNSIPMDAEEAEDVSTSTEPQPETAPIVEQPADPFVSSEEAAIAPLATAVPPVTEPARGPAADPQKMLPDHTNTEKPKRPKSKSSKLRVTIIVLLSLLIVAAIVLDVLLLQQYLKLK